MTFHSAHGLWGQAKFQSADSAPFAALVIEIISLTTWCSAQIFHGSWDVYLQSSDN